MKMYRINSFQNKSVKCITLWYLGNTMLCNVFIPLFIIGVEKCVIAMILNLNLFDRILFHFTKKTPKHIGYIS